MSSASSRGAVSSQAVEHELCLRSTRRSRRIRYGPEKLCKCLQFARTTSNEAAPRAARLPSSGVSQLLSSGMSRTANSLKIV